MGAKKWQPKTDAERLAFAYLCRYCPEYANQDCVQSLVEILRAEYRSGVSSATECYLAGYRAGAK